MDCILRGSNSADTTGTRNMLWGRWQELISPGCPRGRLGHPPRETFPTPHPAFLCLPCLGIAEILQGLWTCEGFWFGQSMDVLSRLRSNGGWRGYLPGLLHFLLLHCKGLVPFAPSLAVPKHTSSSVLPPVKVRET